MQSTSTVSGLSPAQDLFRRLETRGFKLRKGQKAFIRCVNDRPDQNKYSAVLPTGYGKSKAAECVCDILKQQRRATRFLFVVPTDTQRTQYAEGIGNDVEAMGLNLRLMPHESAEGVAFERPIVLSHSAADHRAHRENRCEVYVTTIQGIHANPGFYVDLMATGIWCVFADEYQKLNREDSAKWGRALEALNYSVLFGMTATPVRTDRRPTVFEGHESDVTVSFEDAYKEAAIRGVIAHVEHYFVDVLNEDGEVERITTENVDDYDISRELRFTTKYYASIVASAHACLASKNHKQPGQHQMLIFAMSVAHAKSISDTLNTLYGNGDRFADWVGVGPDGRPDLENANVLKAYKKNQIPCLVQVDKAGEGFDNPRSSVLVFLTLIRKASVRAIQYAGRGLRRNAGIRNFIDDVCDMFASPDTEMAELIEDLANQTLDPEAMGAATDGDATRESPIYDIAPFDRRVQDSEYDRSEIISTLPQAEVDAFSRRVREETGVDVSDERLRRILADDRLEQLEKAQALEQGPDAQKRRVQEAQKLLVSNLLRLRSGISMPKSIAGDLHRVINREWIRLSGRRHDSMLEDDFRAKHDWLADINARLKETRSVPLWLQL